MEEAEEREFEDDEIKEMLISYFDYSVGYPDAVHEAIQEDN